MRMLGLLTLYRPHISGLTAAAANSLETFAAHGHRVTVLSSRFDSTLAEDETLEGVRVHRVDAPWRLYGAPVMRGYRSALRALVRDADVVRLRLPATPIELLAAAWECRRAGVPLLLDHSCDPCLPGGALARVAESGLLLCQSIAARTARAITVATEDYADHSRFLRRLRTPRFIVPHAVRVPLPRPDRVARLRKLYAPNGEKLIGIAARRSAEKGLETLAAALPRVRHRFPDARVLHAGPPEGFGSRGWRQRIQAKIASLGEAWCSLGVLQPDLSAFFAACDVLVVPSLTRLESFGLVQVEAMLCGTPVVASDLPGVRVPVQHTGMGLLAPPGDASALANAVIEVLTHRERFLRPRSAIESEFSSEAHYTAYQRVLDYVGIHD